MAAILVVLHHIHLRFRINGYQIAPFLPEKAAAIAFNSGYYAVICFFVVSGFLITRGSLQRWGSLAQIQPWRFYRLRAARILPCLLLVVTASSLLHLLEVRPFMIRPERGTLGGAVFAALGFHLNWYEGQHGYLPGNWDVLWSLSVEEAFYLLFPLLCLALRTPKAMLIVLLALMVVCPVNRVSLAGQYPWIEYAYLSCFDGIAVGCIAGWISRQWRPSLRAARLAMLVGGAAVMLVVVFRDTTADLGLVASSTHITLLEFGTAAMLLAMAAGVGEGLLARRTALLRVAGRCSYEIYISHMFVVLGFFFIFPRVPLSPAPDSMIYPASYGALLLLSILLGHVVARWFSTPLNQWLRGRSVSTWEYRK